MCLAPPCQLCDAAVPALSPAYSLASEGLECFKSEPAYHSFITSGAEGLDAVLEKARQLAQELREALERRRELDDRLDAAGLPLDTRSATMYRWLATGVSGRSAEGVDRLVEGLPCVVQGLSRVVHMGRQWRMQHYVHTYDSGCPISHGLSVNILADEQCAGSGSM